MPPVPLDSAGGGAFASWAPLEACKTDAAERIYVSDAVVCSSMAGSHQKITSDHLHTTYDGGDQAKFDGTDAQTAITMLPATARSCRVLCQGLP